MSDSILQEKSYAFALRIVNLADYLNEKKHEYILAKKVLDSGTAIGMFVEEARQGDDREDFAQKLSLENKEAFKTHYWLRLLRDNKKISERQASSLLEHGDELKKMLISALKTSRGFNA